MVEKHFIHTRHEYSEYECVCAVHMCPRVQFHNILGDFMSIMPLCVSFNIFLGFMRDQTSNHHHHHRRLPSPHSTQNESNTHGCLLLLNYIMVFECYLYLSFTYRVRVVFCSHMVVRVAQVARRHHRALPNCMHISIAREFLPFLFFMKGLRLRLVRAAG